MEMETRASLGQTSSDLGQKFQILESSGIARRGAILTHLDPVSLDI